MTLQPFYRFISLYVWGNLPSNLQRAVSKLYAAIYNKPFTKFIIKPYCKLNYSDDEYLNQFVSSTTGNSTYSSFQDFFTRVYKTPPQVNSDYVWPCEGLLCDYGRIDSLPAINVKGDVRNISTIFGKSGDTIPRNYYFSNIFLHNNNYHRIHAPVSGRVTSIERIKGDLVLLRPWVYKNDPSLPAMRNERVNIVIEDARGKDWFISIVGGPAVGTIVLSENIKVGAQVNIIDQLGLFLLGSTCCIASPVATQTAFGSTVFVGDNY